jgi:hypothetical protein
MVDKLEWLELMVLELMVLMLAVVDSIVVIFKLVTVISSAVISVIVADVITAVSAVRFEQSTLVGLKMVVVKFIIDALTADKLIQLTLSEDTFVFVITS